MSDTASIRSEGSTSSIWGKNQNLKTLVYKNFFWLIIKENLYNSSLNSNNSQSQNSNAVLVSDDSDYEPVAQKHSKTKTNFHLKQVKISM
jgi:hypothetical protein